MNRIYSFLILCVVPSTLTAQSVVSTVPTQNQLNVVRSADVSATFDTDMNPATITGSSFHVNGMNTGPHTGTVSYDVGSRTATFDADAAFAAGEVITVVLTASIESAGGAPLDGFVWTFTAVSDPAPAIFPQIEDTGSLGGLTSVAVVDLDRDGDLDVCTSDAGSGGPSGSVAIVLLNDGSGSFGDAEYYGVGSAPRAVASSDLDGDTYPDVITGNSSDDDEDVSVAINNGDATFAEDATYVAQYGATSLIAADLDADGDRDIVVGYNLGDDIAVLSNVGGGILGAAVNHPVGATFAGTESVAAADFDRDGDLDVVSVDGDDGVAVFLNDGTGALAPSVGYPAGVRPFWVAVGDVDADGHVDLAVANRDGNSMSILKNLGDGSFGAPDEYAVGQTPVCVCLADLDGDGDLDAATAELVMTGDDLSILLNDGTGTFGPATSFALGTRADFVTAADLEGDGDLDLFVTHATSRNLMILVNEGVIAVDPSTPVHAGFRVGAVTPTPFRPQATVRFTIDAAMAVSAEVLSVAGERVRTLASGVPYDAGTHALTWDGRSDGGEVLPSGMYFIRIETPSGIRTARAVRVR